MEKNLFNLDTNLAEGVDDLMGTEITEAEAALPGNKNNYDETSNPGLPGNKDNYDETAIPHGGKEITADDYNQAIASLQKTFKEAAEVTEMLAGLTVVPQTPDSIQTEYTEGYIAEAIYESFMTGPIYEAVQRKDKDDVKDLVQDIISGLARKIRKAGNVKYVKPSNIMRFLFDPAGIPHLFYQAWTKRLWQIVGLIYIEEGNVEEVISTLNSEYADKLGDYKFLASKCKSPALIDMFRLKLHWKNVQECYTLVIDKKLPSEFKKAEDETDTSSKKADKDDDAADKGDAPADDKDDKKDSDE